LRDVPSRSRAPVCGSRFQLSADEPHIRQPLALKLFELFASIPDVRPVPLPLRQRGHEALKVAGHCDRVGQAGDTGGEFDGQERPRTVNSPSAQVSADSLEALS
jgi:hypothetical protein